MYIRMYIRMCTVRVVGVSMVRVANVVMLHFWLKITGEAFKMTYNEVRISIIRFLMFV